MIGCQKGDNMIVAVKKGTARRGRGYRRYILNGMHSWSALGCALQSCAGPLGSVARVSSPDQVNAGLDVWAESNAGEVYAQPALFTPCNCTTWNWSCTRTTQSGTSWPPAWTTSDTFFKLNSKWRQSLPVGGSGGSSPGGGNQNPSRPASRS
jgi:hypothetical protein